MFKDRSIVVTPAAQVALYSGIPSLFLYYALSLPVATMTPPFGHVAMQLSVNPIPEAAEGIALRHFVINEVLFRWRKHAVVRLLDRFSSVDEMP